MHKLNYFVFFLRRLEVLKIDTTNKFNFQY